MNNNEEVKWIPNEHSQDENLERIRKQMLTLYRQIKKEDNIRRSRSVWKIDNIEFQYGTDYEEIIRNAEECWKKTHPNGFYMKGRDEAVKFYKGCDVKIVFEILRVVDVIYQMLAYNAAIYYYSNDNKTHNTDGVKPVHPKYLLDKLGSMKDTAFSIIKANHRNQIQLNGKQR